MRICDKPIEGASFPIDDTYIQEGNWLARKVTDLKAVLQSSYAFCDLRAVHALNATLIIKLFEAINTEDISQKRNR